jgi:hypothetical protein
VHHHELGEGVLIAGACPADQLMLGSQAAVIPPHRTGASFRVAPVGRFY